MTRETTLNHVTSDAPNLFFCGYAYGYVNRSKARNWSEFFDQILANPIQLAVTRSQYNTLSDPAKKKAKKVPYFTSAAFASNSSRRNTESATSCSLITLDLDTKREADHILNHLHEVKAQLDGLNYAIYHTASSTPESPRLRIVVEAGGIPLSRYPAAVHTLQATLGLETIDPASDKMVQPMYRPSCFKDEDPIKSNPIVHVEKGGKAFHENMIQGERQIGANRPTPIARSLDDTDLDHLRNPVDNLTLDMVAEALNHLDPDMEYSRWLAVAAGMKHQFHGTTEEEDAFELFDSWSAKGQKYESTEETRTKWDSFAHTPKGRAPATIRSLLKMAKEAGYAHTTISSSLSAAIPQVPPSAASVMIASVLAGEHGPTDTPTSLTQAAFNGLATLSPQPSKVEMAVVMTELARVIKTVFKVPVTPAALRGDYRALVKARHAQQYALQRANAVADNDGEFPVPDWVAPFIYISATEQFYNKDTGVSYSARAFNATFSRELTPTAEQVDDPAQLSRPRVLPTDYATNEIRIPVVVDFLYSPAHPPSSIIEENGSLYINTYKPSYAPADASTAALCGNAIETHIRAIISDSEHHNTLLDWMAFQVQHPGVKVRWAPVIIGGQGTGKTLIGQMVGAAIGSTNIRTVEGKSLVSPFQNWAIGSQVVVLEEVRVHGTSRHQIMDTMKPLISNEHIDVPRKNRDNICVRNVTNYIVFSNARDALTLDDSTRRYHICETKQWTAEEVASLGGANYFAPIYKLLNDHPGGFRAYLLQRTIDRAKFDPDIAPKRTAATEEMVEQSACEHTFVMREIIADESNPLIRKDLVSVASLTEAWLNSSGCSSRVSFKYAASILRTEGYERLGRNRLAGEQHSLWVKRGATTATDVQGWVALAQQRIDEAQLNMAQNEFSNNIPTTATAPSATLQQDIDDLL